MIKSLLTLNLTEDQKMKYSKLIPALFIIFLPIMAQADNKLNQDELKTLLVDSTVIGTIKWGFFKYHFNEYYSENNIIEGLDDDSEYTGSYQINEDGCISIKYNHEDKSANGCYYFQPKGDQYLLTVPTGDKVLVTVKKGKHLNLGK